MGGWPLGGFHLRFSYYRRYFRRACRKGRRFVRGRLCHDQSRVCPYFTGRLSLCQSRGRPWHSRFASSQTLIPPLPPAREDGCHLLACPTRNSARGTPPRSAGGRWLRSAVVAPGYRCRPPGGNGFVADLFSRRPPFPPTLLRQEVLAREELPCRARRQALFGIASSALYALFVGWGRTALLLGRLVDRPRGTRPRSHGDPHDPCLFVVGAARLPAGRTHSGRGVVI